ICSGATAQLNGSGTGTYTWTPAATLSNANISNPVASPSVTTTYIMTVTAAAGCDDVDSVTVLVNPTPIVTAGNDVNICANSNIQLNASGATSYVWTPATGLSDDLIANPVASPLITTTYVVTGSTAAGCVDTDTIVVTVSNQLTVTASNDAWICSGNTAPISVNTIVGATYAWLPAVTLSNAAISNPVASPTSTTTYTVLVTDPNGCQGLDSVTVNVSGPISLATSNAVTICIGQNTSISANPSGGIAPYTYAWSNSLTGAGPHTVSPATTITYTVSVTDSLGCVSATQSITVTVNPPLNLSVLGATTICSGDTAILSVTPSGGDGNYAVNWTPGNFTTNSISVNPSSSTTYTVTVTDGCTTPSATASVTVTVNQAPVVTMSADALTGCAPLCVNFTGQSTGNCASVAWDFGDLNASNQQNPTNCYTQAGTYSVTFTCTDAIGCIGTVTIPNMITVNPVPVAAFTSDAPNNLIVLQSGGTAQVCFTDNSQAATTWNWTFDNGTSTQQSPCFQVNDTGYYCAELIVQSTGGCADTTELCIDVENEAVFSIPNVFSPNADGTNDLFTITATGVKNITCELYDRWGVKIYVWDGVNGGWDGRSTSGQAAVDGVYFYVATITDFNNKIIEKQGFVQLVSTK
ncbi:MAG: gliding motility-associated C-terminal domain-containing protein, partial [Bacteroidia bacterium]